MIFFFLSATAAWTLVSEVNVFFHFGALLFTHFVYNLILTTLDDLCQKMSPNTPPMYYRVTLPYLIGLSLNQPLGSAASYF